MDWITENKFKGWLIAILLASNLLLAAILLMQTFKSSEPVSPGQRPRAGESVQLMKQMLNFSGDQTRAFEEARNKHLEQSKKSNDRMSELKNELAEELFADTPDTNRAVLLTKEIGALQTEVEQTRFRLFSELLSVCTPDQKEKVKPVITEFFSRKPPKEDGTESRQNDRREKGERPRIQSEAKTDRPAKPREEEGRKDWREEPPQEQRSDEHGGQQDRPAPPSIEEKLAKYETRLELNSSQKEEVRAILEASHKKNEELRNRRNPDRDEVENLKRKSREEEDANIMKVLTAPQQREFQKMIEKRRK